MFVSGLARVLPDKHLYLLSLVDKHEEVIANKNIADIGLSFPTLLIKKLIFTVQYPKGAQRDLLKRSTPSVLFCPWGLYLSSRKRSS